MTRLMFIYGVLFAFIGCVHSNETKLRCRSYRPMCILGGAPVCMINAEGCKSCTCEADANAPLNPQDPAGTAFEP